MRSRSIRSRLLLRFLPLALGGVLVSSYAAWWYLGRHIEDSGTAHLQTVGSIRHATLDQVFTANRDKLRLLLTRTRLRHGLDEFSRAPGEALRAELRSILGDALGAVEGFRSILLFDTDGNLVTHAGHLPPPATRTRGDYELPEAGDVVVDRFYLDEKDQLGLLWYGDLYRGDTRVGSLAVRAGAADLLAVLADPTGLGATGETFLARAGTDGEVHVITPLRFDPAAALKRTMEDGEFAGRLRELLAAGASGLVRGTDYRGEDVVAVVGFMPGQGVGLVTKIDLHEARAPLRAMGWFLLLVAAGVCALLVAAGVAFSRVISGPVESLTRHAIAVSNGDFSRKARVAGGSTEMQELADALNRMMHNLMLAQQSDHQRSEELELVNRELRDSVDHLTRANDELATFAYTASHDLKEPLRGIHAYAILLEEKYAESLDDEAREKLHALREMSSHMGRVIDDLMYYARLGREDLVRAPVDLNEVVRDVTMDLSYAIEESGARIDSVELPVLRCDPVRVRELIHNLVHNAIKYNRNENKRVEIGVSGELDGVPVLFVCDNGIGIPEKHREVVFRAFKRLHGRDQFGGGSGIGLAIVARIIRKHGGRIWVEAAPGGGTRFLFTLEPGKGRVAEPVEATDE